MHLRTNLQWNFPRGIYNRCYSKKLDAETGMENPSAFYKPVVKETCKTEKQYHASHFFLTKSNLALFL